ncbi:fungal-specific transcription factor domain-containing protein [Ilyonectria sp. MPI-CAGE-AT-0026]|nr:fungal-specific transcription factor domain-containing protein [Ilyonectria sp. MPI-CAGE-AT-0026]
MRRIACNHCRSSKLRCKVKEPDISCERCLSRNVRCSYLPQVSRPFQSPSPAQLSQGSPNFPAANNPQTQSPTAYQLNQETPGLDFGRGRPEDVLREGEFTHSLILLYFSNFSDIHFMFDEELFLKDFAVGQVPKLILYSIMALSIRFSLAPFNEELPPSHRGELLFEHARKLLQRDFDCPSITVIQAYILLSTYKMSFGGSRQSYLYLGFATNMLRALRLLETHPRENSVASETNRRLVCTMALMDRLMTFPLRLPPQFSSQDHIPTMLGDGEFWALKRGTGTLADGGLHGPSSVSVSQEILKLSEILFEVCNAYFNGGSSTALEETRRRFHQYSTTRDSSLLSTTVNLERHKHHDTLRRFAYMHLLYHHVGQLIHFHALKFTWRSDLLPSEHDQIGSSVEKLARECHQHSSAIVTIVRFTWEQGGFDLHNFSIGKILTLATVVNTHALLLASSSEAADRLRAEAATLLACIKRVKYHTRMFIWVLQHLEAFRKICSQNTSTWAKMFDQNPRLLGQMLYLGSHYENVEPQTAGRRPGIGALLLPEVPASEGMHSTSNLAGEMTDHADPQPQDGNLSYLDDFAWIFSDSSLSELYGGHQD